MKNLRKYFLFKDYVLSTNQIFENMEKLVLEQLTTNLMHVIVDCRRLHVILLNVI